MIKWSRKQGCNNKKNRDPRNIKSLIKICIIATAAFILILQGFSLSWFTFNDIIDVDSVSMASDEEKFRLAVYGRNSSAADLALEKLGITDPGESVMIDEMSGKATSGSAQSIKWLMTDENNMNNYDDGLTVEEGISPDSYGSLGFYVIPKVSNRLDMEFYLKMYAYEGSVQSDLEAVDDQKLVDIMNGHILFFLDRDINNIYSGWLENDTDGISGFNDSISSQKNEKIYWIWPNTFAQLVLQSNDKNLLGRKCILPDIVSGVSDPDKYDKRRIINDMKQNPAKYFYREDAGIIDESGQMTDKYKEALENMSTGGTYKAEDYLKLSLAYNKADQCIGEQIQYIMVTLAGDCK